MPFGVALKVKWEISALHECFFRQIAGLAKKHYSLLDRKSLKSWRGEKEKKPIRLIDKNSFDKGSLNDI